MNAVPSRPLHIHGWTVFMHPLFVGQLQALSREVEGLRQRDPAGYARKNAAKRLAAIRKLVFDVIPQDPTRPDSRQGQTLGHEHRHWFRAKFFQQYRLFFRFHAASRIIVFAWVNDAGTLRAYESDDDAYKVFRKMLSNGHPPGDWDDLLAQAQSLSSQLPDI